MANRAVLRETRRRVIRIVRLVEVGEVAPAARGWRACEAIVRVTLNAAQAGVSSREDEAGLAVIEGRTCP